MRQSAERREDGRDDDVMVSEVAAYAYCAKAWHLERVLGVAPSDAAARRRSAGVDRHAVHGARVVRLRRAGPALAWGAVVLLTLAVLAVAVLLVLGR